MAACPEEIKNFYDAIPGDITYAMTLKTIIGWLERNKQYKLTRADINRVKNSPDVKQIAATVEKTVTVKGDGVKQPDPTESPAKDGGSTSSSKKNKHFGLTCYFCKKRNHIALNCRLRIAKDAGESKDDKTGSTPDAKDTSSTGAIKKGGEDDKSGPVKCFKGGGRYHIAKYCLKDVDLKNADF